MILIIMSMIPITMIIMTNLWGDRTVPGFNEQRCPRTQHYRRARPIRRVRIHKSSAGCVDFWRIGDTFCLGGGLLGAIARQSSTSYPFRVRSWYYTPSPNHNMYHFICLHIIRMCIYIHRERERECNRVSVYVSNIHVSASYIGATWALSAWRWIVACFIWGIY